jgi:N-acetylmuramoyl-L-alanine amidase
MLKIDKVSPAVLYKVRYCLLIMAAMLGLVGCQIGPKAPTTMSFRLSPFELAGRLGLNVTEETDRYIEMKNGTNRVLVFIHDGGRVFVNQTPIGSTGPVTRLNGMLYLPEILESMIRPHLRSASYITPTTPKSQWIPPKSKPAGGLIVIDAGHGGKDSGATSYLGHYEKGINLRIANKVIAKLKAKGFTVKMTRSSDTYIDRFGRAEVTNNIAPDLFVSIHCNSLPKTAMRGYTVYTSRSASADSRMAAGLVEDAMMATGLPSRGVQGGDYIVLVNTSCPAILVECGCLSNPQEAGLLYDSGVQDRIATAIANGIEKAMARL